MPGDRKHKYERSRDRWIKDDGIPYTLSGRQYVYPQGNGIGVTANPAFFTYGLWTEIIPANTITVPFWIVGILTLPATSGLWQTAIGMGLAGNEEHLAEWKHHWFMAGGIVASVINQVYLPYPIKVPANTRIVARTMRDLGGFSCNVSALYVVGL